MPLPQGTASRVDLAGIHESIEEGSLFCNLLTGSARLRAVLTELFHCRSRYAERGEFDGVDRTIKWMRENLGSRTELPKLARLSGSSVAKYSQQFRQKTGTSPINYFLRMKIRHACGLLAETSLRVEEIANAVGFEDPFYFSRIFRQIMGLSPRKFRSDCADQGLREQSGLKT